MICCNKCFCDSQLIPIIESLNQKGNCLTCGSSGVYIYDTNKNFELTEYFDNFLSIYTPSHLLPSEIPKSQTFMLKDELNTNWNILNKLQPTKIYDIITNICQEKYKDNPEIFDSPVGITEFKDIDYLREHSLLRTNDWEEFVRALKRENRFHTNLINLEILNRFCSFIRKAYKKGDTFYRGRISSSTGIESSQMGAPPYEKASAGRANSLGISCLYLAKDVETTIHEIRSGAFDFVTVGKFELQEDIIVVDLKAIDKISPFVEKLDCMEYAINKEHLNKINSEMGKAMRRSDSSLDYVPTQYISDFIKSIVHKGKPEYAGIEYNSTMNPSGFNLAIFDPKLFDCINVETYKIKDIRYTKELI